AVVAKRAWEVREVGLDRPEPVPFSSMASLAEPHIYVPVRVPTIKMNGTLPGEKTDHRPFFVCRCGGYRHDRTRDLSARRFQKVRDEIFGSHVGRVGQIRRYLTVGFTELVTGKALLLLKYVFF